MERFRANAELMGTGAGFVQRYTQCFVDLLKRRKIDLKVTDVCVLKKA